MTARGALGKAPALGKHPPAQGSPPWTLQSSGRGSRVDLGHSVAGNEAHGVTYKWGGGDTYAWACWV